MIRKLITDLRTLTGFNVEYQRIVSKTNKENYSEFMILKTDKKTLYRNITGSNSITVLTDFLKMVKGTETFIDDWIFYLSLQKYGEVVV